MSNEDTKLFSEAEIARMAREIGQPLPGDLKKRIMDQVRARSPEPTITPTPQTTPAKKKTKDHKRDRGIEP